MLSRLLLVGALVLPAFAQTSSQVEVANLREDLRGLTQRVGELALRVEQLERENGELRAKAGAAPKTAYATVAQLRDAIADLRRSLEADIATSKNETLERVATQMEKLAKQTNAALDSLAKVPTPRAAAPAAAAASAAEAPAKEGGTYTVQKGETLAVIAKKTGVKMQDIAAANKLADPSHIVVGQTLLIPNSNPAGK